MASPILTTPSMSAPARRRPAPYRSAWPADLRARVLLGLLFSAPYVALAIRAHSHGYKDGANAALEQRSQVIQWGSGNLGFIGHVYPPLPTAVASLLPNALALGIVGALAAGAVLQALGARLADRGYPTWAVLLLLTALGASPSFALTATTDLSSFMALALLALALDGFMRFVFLGQTHGGFQAGLTIGIAGLCDPTAVVFAVGFTAAAPLIAHTRYRAERAAGRATAAVLLFPTVAGIAGWIFLCWRFTGSPLGWLRRQAPALWSGGGSLHQALSQSAKPVLLTPIFLLALLLLALRGKLLPAFGICLPLVCILIATWAGLTFGGLSIAIVLGIVGLVSLPPKPSRAILTAVLVVAAAGLAMKWTYPPSAAVTAWEHALARR